MIEEGSPKNLVIIPAHTMLYHGELPCWTVTDIIVESDFLADCMDLPKMMDGVQRLQEVINKKRHDKRMCSFVVNMK